MNKPNNINAPENGSKGNNFWSRQSAQDRILIGAFALEMLISVVLIVWGVNMKGDEDSSIPGRLTLIAGNIVALIAVLQFSIARFFDQQKSETDGLRSEFIDLKRELSRSMDEMESITVLGETYVKIFKQEDSIKDQYQSTLDAFMRRLSLCIDDKRSGALDIMHYYDVLESTANEIEQNKRDFSDGFKGEIWALSFMLDDEWDEESRLEVKWFEHLQKMDEGGIPTRRLWAFDKKMINHLKKEELEDEGKEILNRLALYCSIDTPFNNTKSFALPKDDILDEHVNLFGKGFFATALTEGELRLIRGVCFDNLFSSNALGGEIDFDADRIKKIQSQWNKYLKLASPLKEFLDQVSSESAKEYMKKAWDSKEGDETPQKKLD